MPAEVHVVAKAKAKAKKRSRDEEDPPRLLGDGRCSGQVEVHTIVCILGS